MTVADQLREEMAQSVVFDRDKVIEAVKNGIWHNGVAYVLFYGYTYTQEIYGYAYTQGIILPLYGGGGVKQCRMRGDKAVSDGQRVQVCRLSSSCKRQADRLQGNALGYGVSE